LLLSVFPTLPEHEVDDAAVDGDCVKDEDDCADNSGDDDDSDNLHDDNSDSDSSDRDIFDHDRDDEDSIDSNTSDDSIMMPSFSDISSLQLPDARALSFSAPEVGALGIAADLPSRRLIDRGADSAASGSSNVQQMKTVLKSVGGVVPDPRLCMSVAPNSTLGLHQEGASHSVPASGSSRLRGRMHYGTKPRLRQLASVWQNYAERYRQDGTVLKLPTEGIIMNDFRDVSFLIGGNKSHVENVVIDR